MRSGIGNSAQDPLYVTNVGAAGVQSPAGTQTDPYFTQAGSLPAGTDRSGSAATSTGVTIPANASRRGLEIQNIGANNIGVNEFGGTAAIGTAGTFTLTPGSTFKVRTNRAISMIAATGATAFSATEY